MDRARENELVRHWRESKNDDTGWQLWTEVLSRIEKKVMYSAAMLGFKNEYEDVLNETFVEVRENVLEGKYDPEGPASLSGYSLVIANRKLSQMNKQRKRQQKLKQQLAERTPREKPDDPTVEGVAIKEMKAYLLRAVPELPEPVRRVFCLYKGIWVFEDYFVESSPMTFEEIGEVFGRSRWWAKDQYTRARIILQKKLSG